MILCLLLLGIAAFWQGLSVQHYIIPTDRITSSVRLALLTDLHSTRYGENQRELIEAIQKQEPDLILLVGDIADDEVPHDAAWELLSAIAEKYPCYYVAGNHEFWADDTEGIKEQIRSFGVEVLEGTSKTIEIRGQEVQISGVDDPARFSGGARLEDSSVPAEWLDQFQTVCAQVDEDAYSILLSHRPELVDYYEGSGFDLVVSGHAHGGQVRIPGILNGLFAPNQGFFPQYAGGKYELGETTLVVSRGLSKSRLPRIFNPPELVVINLYPAR